MEAGEEVPVVVVDPGVRGLCEERTNGERRYRLPRAVALEAEAVEADVATQVVAQCDEDAPQRGLGPGGEVWLNREREVDVDLDRPNRGVRLTDERAASLGSLLYDRVDDTANRCLIAKGTAAAARADQRCEQYDDRREAERIDPGRSSRVHRTVSGSEPRWVYRRRISMRRLAARPSSASLLRIGACSP